MGPLQAVTLTGSLWRCAADTTVWTSTWPTQVNVALAARYQTDTVLTLDRRDFRALRPLSRHPAFRLLPDDQ